MVNNQEIFEKIKNLLSRHVLLKVDDLDYGRHMTIDQTGIWLETDSNELTIGYDLPHIHYNADQDSLRQAIERLFNLLTRRKRITLYFKGAKVFKEKTEIELDNNEYQHVGTALTWMIPFWKRTTKQITFEEPLINSPDIEKEIKEIYKFLADKAPVHNKRP